MIYTTHGAMWPEDLAEYAEDYDWKCLAGECGAACCGTASATESAADGEGYTEVPLEASEASQGV